MKNTSEEWLKAAKDDLDVIGRIIDVAHLTHIVAFHAQQCIEKVFKALMEEHDIDTPKIHNLVTLYGRIETVAGADLNVPLRLLIHFILMPATQVISACCRMGNRPWMRHKNFMVLPKRCIQGSRPVWRTNRSDPFFFPCRSWFTGCFLFGFP